MRGVQKWFMALSALGLLMFLAAPALADWKPGDPNTKWVQLPDLTPLGMDVKATAPKILADDWKCNDPRPVTDIHFWGSWKNDQFPADIETAFRVQIWSDVPAGSGGTEYSHPGVFLWEATDFTVVVPNPISVQGEGWFDPNTGEYIPDSDRYVWQLNLDVSKHPFRQKEGEIYWLVVQAWFPDGTVGPELGWKTTDPSNHQLDNAVWADGELLPGIIPPAWQLLLYPTAHPEYPGQSIDLSFVITVPEPGTLALLATAGLGLLLFAWRRRK